MGDGHSTYRVSADKLEEYSDKIAAFSSQLHADPGFQAVSGFSGGSGGPGTYSKLYAGTGKVGSDKQLEDRFKSLCASLLQQLTFMEKGTGRLSRSLLEVKDILLEGEDEADIDARAMMQDLQPAIEKLGGGGGSAAPPTT